MQINRVSLTIPHHWGQPKMAGNGPTPEEVRQQVIEAIRQLKPGETLGIGDPALGTYRNGKVDIAMPDAGYFVKLEFPLTTSKIPHLKLTSVVREEQQMPLLNGKALGMGRQEHERQVYYGDYLYLPGLVVPVVIDVQFNVTAQETSRLHQPKAD